MLSVTCSVCRPPRRARAVLRASESGNGADQPLRAKIRRAAAGALRGDPGQHGVMKLVQHRAAAARAQPDRLNAAFLVCAYAGTMGCT